MAGGRPTKYKPEYVDQARQLCLLGATDAQMAEFFGVVEATINTWKQVHPEFLESIKSGKLMADAMVADSLFQRARGYSHSAVKIMQYEGIPIEVDYTEHYPPDTTAALAWLHNRQPALWRRNRDPAEGQDDLPPTKVIFEVRDARSPDRKSEPESPAG